MRFIVSVSENGKGRKIGVIINEVCPMYTANIVAEILQSVTDYYVTEVKGLMKMDITKHVFEDLASAIRFLQEFKFYHHHRETVVTYNHVAVQVPSNWTLACWRNRIYLIPDQSLVETEELREACETFLSSLFKKRRTIYRQSFLKDYEKGTCFYFCNKEGEDSIENNIVNLATTKEYSFVHPEINAEFESRWRKRRNWQIYDELIESILK